MKVKGETPQNVLKHPKTYFNDFRVATIGFLILGAESKEGHL